MTATMTLYGFAAQADGRLHGMADRRVFDSPGRGFKTIRVRPLRISWPNTPAGAKKACAWSLTNNVKSNAARRPR